VDRPRGLLRTFESLSVPAPAGVPLRERAGNARGHRYGARGGKNNPNVQWHSMRARAKAEGWYDHFLANYSKPQ